jgi:polysaccharide biosynthesis transport protein
MNDGTPLADENRPTQGRLVPAGQTLPTGRDPYGPLGSYPGAYAEAAPEFGLNLREYWRILIKRKWVVLSVLVAFVALGGVRALMMTPLYTSTVRLQIDRNVSRVVENGNITPMEGADFDFLRTQYELLQSRTMAERVVVSLRLGDDVDFLEARQFSIFSYIRSLFSSPEGPSAKAVRRTDREKAAAGVILENRSVRPVAGSRLVEVSYSDPDPARAQRIATALGDAFIASNLDKRFEANAYAKTFLEDQLQHLKLRLEESEKQLLDFAQKEQIVAVNEKSSIAENNLASANAALGNLVSERIKNEQLWKQVASADAINMAQLLTNAVIEGLRAQRNALVTEYQEKRETFKPSYPGMLQITNKIAEIDRQLAHEVQTIKDSLKASFEASKSQEEEMKKQIESLRAAVLDLQKRSIQYNILKREVDTNRSLYEGLLQRQKEVDIAGGVGANNVFIVDKAQVPGSPSSPNIPRALLLALALGLGAGLGAAYLLEQFDDTLRSAEEVERITGLTTLGVIPKLAPTQTAEVEIADLRSSFSEAYRTLCTALQFTTDSGLPRSLAITSAAPSEGKSITSFAIARHFATMGLKVLLVDADLRNPSLHKKLGCDNGIGLSNYLTGACTPPEVFQTTNVANLAFMASGPIPPNAADLLSNARLLSLLSVGAEVFNLIVLDSPPVMGLADAALLANAAAATVFVIAAGQARGGHVRGGLKRLQLGRSPVIGAVLTKYDAAAAGYGYGDYGYGYGYGYGSNNVGQDTPHASLPSGATEPRLRESRQ